MTAATRLRAAYASLLAAGSLMIPSNVWAADETQRVAVIAFDYSDSSGEPEDQTAEHAARLGLFRDTLQTDLDTTPALDAVAMPCMARNCTVSTMRPDRLLRESRDEKVDFLVFGGVHKMSTLVGGGRVMVLDVAKDRIVFDRVISFRGDDDEAFIRAAHFSARDIARSVLAPETPSQGRQGKDRGAR